MRLTPSILGMLTAVTIAACAPAPTAPVATAPVATSPAGDPPAETSAPAPEETIEEGTAADCTAICEQVRGMDKISAISCVEGELEELGFTMDEGACDSWENAAAGGGGDPCDVFMACQAAAGFTNGHCATISSKCL